MSLKIPSIKLNNGLDMPLLGLGTWSYPGSPDRQKVAQAVYDAIVAGYRHIDTAYLYKVEDQVGEGCRRAIDEGLVKREELFIVTKIWITNMTRDRLLKQAKESNEVIGLGYIDCLLIHFPGSAKPTEVNLAAPQFEDDGTDINAETWPAMEEVLAAGITKSIGVSNYNCRQIEELMKVAKVAPVTNQVESTPFLPQLKLMEVCGKYGIVLTAYSPLGGNMRPDGSESKARQSLPDNPVVKKLAEKYNKSPQQILLKFHVARGIVVIPKSMTKERIISNGQIFDFDLTTEEIKELEGLADGSRTFTADFMTGHRNFPFHEE